MGSARRLPTWFLDITGQVSGRSRSGSRYPAEGTPASQCPKCGGPREWMYIGKRRRPKVMCLACDDVSGRNYAPGVGGGP